MENISYRIITKVLAPITTPVLGYPYWETSSSIVSPEKDYIPVPIAFEAGIKPDQNPYYALIHEEHVGELAGIPQILYRNPEAVEPYLASHPEIQAFFLESWAGLVKYFGENVDMILEVITYPGEEAYDELVGWIQSIDEIGVGLDKLEKFEEEWLETQLLKVGNRFNFNIEFK